MFIKPLCFAFLCLATLLLSGCRDSEQSESGKPLVFVPVPPYQEIANRLAGDIFEIHSIVSESDDPHDFSPTPKQVVRFTKAAVLFTGQMPFEENLIKKLSSGKSKVKVFNLTENIELLEGNCEHHDAESEEEVYVYVKGQDEAEEKEHDHEHEEHAHEGHAHEDHDHAHHDHDHHAHELDPHVWLSPRILQAQAKTMAGVLKNAATPEQAAQIDQNLKTVLSDLDDLDRELTEKLAFMKGQTFYVYHGAFAYFAKAYGLKQEAIELGGRRPEPKRLAELVGRARDQKVKLIFVQPQFDQSSAKSLADSIGGKVVALDPLERDIFANLRKIADTVGQSAP